MRNLYFNIIIIILLLCILYCVILLLCRITVGRKYVGGATGFHSNNECVHVQYSRHARFPFASCKIDVLHGCKTCKKSSKPVLVRFLQVRAWLWPLFLQFARFLSKHTRFSGKMCQILLQAWPARFLQEPNVWDST